mgnify:CR=1 FL=1
MKLVLFQFIDLFFNIYTFMVFIYILMSWVPNLRESSFGEILGKFVEPVLAPFRKIIPPLGIIDISPIVALLALRLARNGAIALVDMLL